MNFITTIGYHDAYFEVEIIVAQFLKTKEEGKRIGNDSDLTNAILYKDKIIVGKDEKRFIVHKKDTNLYQFKVCSLTEEEIQSKGNMLSHEDYQNVSWDEAIHYFEKEYRNETLPFSLEGYYYAVYENEVTFSS